MNFSCILLNFSQKRFITIEDLLKFLYKLLKYFNSSIGFSSSKNKDKEDFKSVNSSYILSASILPLLYWRNFDIKKSLPGKIIFNKKYLKISKWRNIWNKIAKKEKYNIYDKRENINFSNKSIIISIDPYNNNFLRHSTKHNLIFPEVDDSSLLLRGESIII